MTPEDRAAGMSTADVCPHWPEPIGDDAGDLRYAAIFLGCVVLIIAAGVAARAAL